MARAGGDVIGLDWRHPARRGLGPSATTAACRGTSTRRVLLGPWEHVEAARRDVLARAGGRPGHIFNLGHGVLPRTDPDVLDRVGFAALVRARARGSRTRTLVALP